MCLGSEGEKKTWEKRTIDSGKMRLSLFGVKSVIFWVICRITWQILCEICPSMYLIASWLCQTSLVAQTVNNLPTVQKTQALSLGRGDPLETGMTTHSGILAWKLFTLGFVSWMSCSLVPLLVNCGNHWRTFLPQGFAHEICFSLQWHIERVTSKRDAASCTAKFPLCS